MSGLFSVPFYPALVGRWVQGGKEADGKGVKLTTAYVLLIGAIIAHSNGKLNCCVASLDVLAEETGSTEKKVRDYRSELIREGVIEVLEKDRSGFIVSVRVNDAFVCEMLGKSGGKAFPKKGKGIPEKRETVTEVGTGVGEYIIDISDENNEQEERKVRMKPAVLYSRLKSIYHIRKDADKKSCLVAVEKLQEAFDDDTLLAAARYFYTTERNKPTRFEDGRLWWPEFFWVLDPRKTEAVIQRIKRIPGLFSDEPEASEEPDGYMKGVWHE